MLSLLAALRLALPAPECSALAGAPVAAVSQRAPGAPRWATIARVTAWVRRGTNGSASARPSRRDWRRRPRASAADCAASNALSTDLEAIRGLATIKDWPLHPVPEPSS